MVPGVRIETAGHPTWIFRLTFAVFAVGVAESESVITNGFDPAGATGVPITEQPTSCVPGGRLPLCSEQLYGGIPFCAVIWQV